MKGKKRGISLKLDCKEKRVFFLSFCFRQSALRLSCFCFCFSPCSTLTCLSCPCHAKKTRLTSNLVPFFASRFALLLGYALVMNALSHFPLIDVDTIPGPAPRPNSSSKSSKTNRLSSSSSTQPPPPVGLGLNGISSQKSSEFIQQWVTPPLSGPSYFDITPSHNTSPPSSKKSAGYVTKTPGRRTKRTPAHSISSTITNGGTSSRRVSCTLPDNSSQNSASFLDEREVEIDENSFYIHLQRMQERHAAQQEPGWLRTQHALLQAKHRIPSSGQQHLDVKGRKAAFVPGSQPFLSRIHSNSSSPSSSDYGSSPSFYPGLQQPQRQSYTGSSSSQRQQPVHALNCFQPGNVICVPRERTLGGLIFHKTFVGMCLPLFVLCARWIRPSTQ